MITFTVLAQLRGLFWANQKVAYDLLLKTAWQTIDCFARRDPQLQGRAGAQAMLHTHARNLDYHPHAHLIVPAVALNERTRQWRQKRKVSVQGLYMLVRVPNALPVVPVEGL